MNKASNRTPGRAVIRLIGPLLFIGIIYFFVDIHAVISTIRGIDITFFLLSLLVIPLSTLIRSKRWQLILQNFDIQLPYLIIIKITFFAMVVGCIFPLVGNFIKLIYFGKSKKALVAPLKSIVVEKILDLAIPIVFFIAAYFSLCYSTSESYELFDLTILISGAAILLFLLHVFFTNKILLEATHRIAKREGAIGSLFSHLESIHNCVNWKTIALSVADYFFTSCLQTYFLILSINMAAAFIPTVFLAAIKEIAGFVPLSYFGIGIREVGFIGAFGLLDYNTNNAVSLGAVVLLFQIVLAFFGAALYLIHPPLKTTE